MLFKDVGVVPFCMTTQEHLTTKFSQYDGPQLKDNTKVELLGNLKRYGLDISLVKGKSVGDMQDISR